VTWQGSYNEFCLMPLDISCYGVSDWIRDVACDWKTIYTEDTIDIRRHKEARNSYKYDLQSPLITRRIRDKNTNSVPSSILIIKPTRCTNFSNLFGNRTLRVSGRFSVHHQESSTVHTAIGICYTGYVDCLLAGSGWNSSRQSV